MEIVDKEPKRRIDHRVTHFELFKMSSLHHDECTQTFPANLSKLEQQPKNSSYLQLKVTMQNIFI